MKTTLSGVMPSGNTAFIIRDVETLIEHWPFLLEGLKVLNKPSGARGDQTPEQFFKLLLLNITCDFSEGFVGILKSKSGKNLGFGVVGDGSELYSPTKLCVGYLFYSAGRHPNAGLEMVQFAERWARHFGYKEIHAQSRRINGAAMRVFEKKLKFRRFYVGFKKEL